MRRKDWSILIAGIVCAVIWTTISSRHGFKGNNAMIVARSISVTSTMNGQVENEPPEVGTRVSPSDLLVRIYDQRIDRGRQTEYESERANLQREIAAAHTQQEQLDDLLQFNQQKFAAHKAWMLKDVELRMAEAKQLLKISQNHATLKTKQARRTASLHDDSHSSTAAMEEAQIEAQIAVDQENFNQARLSRSNLLLQSVDANDMFFDNGDASYWEKMVDSLTLRQIDNFARIATLESELARVNEQASVEQLRIGASVAENHYAPFSGMINATYVAKGTRVTTGASLLQILDCSDPVVIVPLPEHRIGEFQVGMNATIYPVDTDKRLSGVVEYISSGPLIGDDQTLAVQEQLTSSGVHAVVGFAAHSDIDQSLQSCESAHRAVVVIHTRTNPTTARVSASIL